jgi:glycerol-3-phosphate dehydrogenase
LARRSRLAFLNAASALDALPRVIELMGKELTWSNKRRAEEMSRARAFLTTMGLDSPEGQSDFNAQELVRFREAFQSMDLNGDGKVSAADLDKVLKQMGIHVQDEKEIQKVIDEVDSNRNGTVEVSRVSFQSRGKLLEIVSSCLCVFPLLFSFLTSSKSCRH